MTTRARYLTSSSTVAGVTWRRSSHSTAANNCVEAAELVSGQLAVRDSKDRLGPALLFAPNAWSDFVQALAADGLAPVRP
ncbi:DUF397 domain-containing protein [Streptomyces sp. NBC_01190]|uniref:DUF397 domain-containing protein n=1 Tax=Streptomyces sp. NBC_01190 TaxID=2903767 RepID=UPI00386E7E5A|nr:DUF397 domain-containing protein [Streptomyces sp. NBC_01190]